LSRDISTTGAAIQHDSESSHSVLIVFGRSGLCVEMTLMLLHLFLQIVSSTLAFRREIFSA
jgi:hypothetical protein